MLAYAILAFVILQRLAELIYARRNTVALLKRGGVEVGRKHYPLIVGLHLCWFVAIALNLPQQPVVKLIWLCIFAVLQLSRLWVLAELGPYWTTRIITLKGAPLIRTGPYRLFRHPNYIIVASEICVLPMVFGQWGIAIAFSVLNVLVLIWRIRVEEKALAGRQEA